MEKERVFVDMDGVLAKFNHVQSEEELYEKGYFANLEPLPTVVDGMKRYIKENPDKDIYILSAYLTESPYALQEKNEWLDRYLPEISSDHRIFCPCGKPKADYIIGGIQKTDILIDDYTKNLVQWKEQGGIGVKLLNGINHTRGTWEGFCMDYQNNNIDLALQDVVKTVLKRKEYSKMNSVIEMNKENFPDDLFRAYLQEQFGTVLTQETIQNTKELILKPSEEGLPGIVDLTGIEHFTALEKLDCSHHNLTKLDVSRNPELTYLDCGYNYLTELDVSHNPQLTELRCYHNRLKSLNVSHNLALEYLDCSCNLLTNLNVDYNTELKILRCSENVLESLDVSKNPHITKLMCMHNHIHTLDISNNTDLEKLFCNHNQFSQLDVNKNANLTVLVCSHNHLSSLDVTRNLLLKELSCIGNRTGMHVDMSNNSLLYASDVLKRNPGVIPITNWLDEIKKGKNLMEPIKIDATNFPDENFRSYVRINFDKDGDGSLSAKEIAKITRIYCAFNWIKSLQGIEHFTNLKELICNNNPLTELDISKNIALTSLNCDANQLVSLDVSQNTKLTHLACDENLLTELDVSKNTAFTYLHCRYNQLENLDVSKNTKLIILDCRDNQLAELDVTQNLTLEYLVCDNNRLSALDVSKNPKLTHLDCRYNQLTDLDISRNSELEYLQCDDEVLIKKDFYEHEKESDKSQNPEIEKEKNIRQYLRERISHEHEEDLDL